ncbi:hypothetical protein RhiirA5_384418 [Rhizophagus irregularis]|uniref:Uncharacterized protein n=1 Tax=Rhizophagus irregularis TaxID=588596 RepID=A0A2N0NT74_9GLOM|nr:hypothetical protein RhiirA5_384418 [Rhizophagus irregularis]
METWDNFWHNIKNQLNNLDQDFLEDSVNLAEYSQEDIDRNTHTNIIIDKVLVNKEPGILTKRLATEPDEVKKAVDNDFARMFRKRNTLLETMTPLWQQIYEPAVLLLVKFGNLTLQTGLVPMA